MDKTRRNPSPRIITPDQAVARLESLCGRSERCTSELALRLRRWHIDDDCAQKILEHLRRAGFLNDSRFARAFARDKALLSRWGPRKIAMALRIKGISSNDISKSLAEVPEEVFEENLVVLLGSKGSKGKASLWRAAAMRGYAPDMISRLLRTDFSEFD